MEGKIMRNFKITKKHLAWNNGYIRFRNEVEIHWGFHEWALLLNIHFSKHLIFIDILFLQFIIPKAQQDIDNKLRKI